MLCGSLAHDTVWARSDIDLVLITIDDKKIDCGGRPCTPNGVNVHALLMPRTRLRQTVEGSLGNSFMQLLPRPRGHITRYHGVFAPHPALPSRPQAAGAAGRPKTPPTSHPLLPSMSA